MSTTLERHFTSFWLVRRLIPAYTPHSKIMQHKYFKAPRNQILHCQNRLHTIPRVNCVLSPKTSPTDSLSHSAMRDETSRENERYLPRNHHMNSAIIASIRQPMTNCAHNLIAVGESLLLTACYCALLLATRTVHSIHTRDFDYSSVVFPAEVCLAIHVVIRCHSTRQNYSGRTTGPISL